MPALLKRGLRRVVKALAIERLIYYLYIASGCYADKVTQE